MLTHINRPTLMLNPGRVKKNIRLMTEKTQRQGIRFRPHFKTHQSAAIGEWFRQAGVSTITVSSVEMAQYFAQHGWNNITIAFPINLRQIGEIHELARSIHLGLLVESIDSATILLEQLSTEADIWIEIDEGSNRSGISWDQPKVVLKLAQLINSGRYLHLKGILTHAGRIYHAGSPERIRSVYKETADRMNSVRGFLSKHDISVEVSVGDTPGCTLVTDLGKVDEIRPGNFVFFDAMQLAMGVCQLQDIAAVVACPIVARYPDRNELVIYGGAVHFSKDTVEIDNQNWYGVVVNMNENAENGSVRNWISRVQHGYLARLSQEHGVVVLPESTFKQIKVGSLVFVIPAHICLTVSAMGEYTTAAGQILLTMNKE